MSAPKLLPALLGGLFIGVLSSLPFVSAANTCCCLWVVTGGMLATWLMQQNTPRPVTLGEGALVGLMSGLVGAVVWVIWSLIQTFAFGVSPFDFAEFQRALNDSEMPPEAREALENLSPAVMLAVGGVIWTVVSTVFATLGGLIGAALFKKKGGPTNGAPVPPAPGYTPPTPGFTPPTFSPPAPPAGVPPPPSPPAPPPVSSGGSFGSFAPPAPPAGPPPSPPAPPAPPAGWPPVPSESEPYAGDAPTVMIPAHKLNLPPKPPAPPAPPAPPSGVVPPPDRDPEPR